MEPTNNLNQELDKLNIGDKEQEEEDTFDTLAQENKEKNLEAEVVVSKNVDKENEPENQLKDNNELYFLKNATWDSLQISDEFQKGLLDMHWIRPSRIQASAYALVNKKPYTHLMAQSQNGSGKTGAFGISVLTRIDPDDPSLQAVVFEHTKDMVNQTADVFKQICKYTSIKIASLASKEKTDGAQVIVTTPVAFENQYILKKKNLSKLKFLVVDEADYMLSNESMIGPCEKMFKIVIDSEIACQVLLFSATFKPEHKKIVKNYFKKAYMIELQKETLTLKNVQQFYFRCTKREEKVNFIEEYLKNRIEMERVIIFVNTRDYVQHLAKTLRTRGYVVYILMGGDMDPVEREETRKKFKSGDIQILITTNVLARGFDEKLCKLIINFDLPVIKNNMGQYEPDYETYLHRIGRTGRFGTEGIGLTLISSDDEFGHLKMIQEFYQSNIEEIKSSDELLEEFKKILKEKF